MVKFRGEIVSSASVAAEYQEARSVRTRCIGLWPDVAEHDETMSGFRVDELLVTSQFVAIDTARGRMFLDQSYAGLETLFPTRFALRPPAYELACDPVRVEGRFAVLGGPFDGAWYHWLFNWCPRLLLLAWLWPELEFDPELRIVVHPRALQGQFRSVLETFQIPERQLFVVDPNRDYLFETAYLIPFPDQRKLYPELVRDFSRHLLTEMKVETARSGRGVFASRQSLPAPKRRIHNFADIAPVLAAQRIEVVDCGALSARDQARIFHSASLVVGAHGSDLSNILFCRPKTPVIVIETKESVGERLHIGLLRLAEILDLDYRLLVSRTAGEPADGMSAARRAARDYVVDPLALASALREADAAARLRAPSPRPS